MITHFYVKVEYPAYFMFWGPFDRLDKAQSFVEARVYAFKSARCRIVEVSASESLPTGKVIGYVQQESVVV